MVELVPPHLFDPGYSKPPEKLSAGRRRTESQRALLRIGRHPATHLDLLQPEGHTCGDCKHHVARGGGGAREKTYHKCLRSHLGDSFSAASDIRVSWPACTAWGPVEEA